MIPAQKALARLEALVSDLGQSGGQVDDWINTIDIALSDYQAVNKMGSELLAACEAFINAAEIWFCATPEVNAAYKAAREAVHKVHTTTLSEESS